jgi:3'-phosphoadenosine 5'-phosphosulfate sulfotransferase (PAPS reductase)/FAD synthetase
VKQRLSTYLRQLEAESIYIMREVAAEFRNPVRSEEHTSELQSLS